jgi:GMP synthase-like glutamine amidotransferase
MSSVKRKMRIAVLDLYENVENQGLSSICQIAHSFLEARFAPNDFELKIYDVRAKNELPSLNDFDAIISSGGPGSPISSSTQEWDIRWGQLLDDVLAYNKTNPHKPKPCFLICHSFQLACRHWDLGLVNARHSAAYGVLEAHPTDCAKNDPVFCDMPDLWWTVENRYFQVTQINTQKIQNQGGQVLAYEKRRPNKTYEQAIVALYFGHNIWGTQFHPEVSAEAFLKHLSKPHIENKVLEEHGPAKLEQIKALLQLDDRIEITRNVVLISFLKIAYEVFNHSVPKKEAELLC